MGIFNKTIKLSMDYAQFDGSVTEINRKMKQLDSEFKIAKENAKSYADEQTQLEIDMQNLSEKIEMQTKIVSKSKDAYEKASSEGKATNKQLDYLKQSYLNNQVALAKLNNEYTENEEKLKNASNGIEDTNRKIKILDSEYELAKEKTKLYADEQTKLKDAMQHLSDKIALQTQKVNLSKEAFDKATSEGKATAKQLDDLQQTYLSNQISLSKMNNELTECDDKLQKLEDSAKDTSEPLGKLDDKLKSGKDSAVEYASKLYLLEEAIGIVKDATKAYVDFDSSISKINTLADTSVISITKLKEGVYDIAKETGKGAKDISDAMYEALSANVKTEDAFKVTLAAAKLAKAGFTDTATSVDVLTTIMNAYQMSASDVVSISDKLLKVQDLGKTTVGEFGDSFGKVAGLAKEANVSLDEVLAAVSTLTKINGSASESITALKSGISNIIKPTAEASEIAQQLGLKFSASALQSQGFARFLENVQKKTHGNTETMAKLFGSVEALNAMLVLTGSGAESFSSDLKDIENSSGTTETSLKNLKGTGNNFNDAIENLRTTLIQLGDALSPVIKFVTQTIEAISSIPAPILAVVAVIAIMMYAIKQVIVFKAALAVANMAATASEAALGTASAASAGKMMIVFLVIAAVIALLSIFSKRAKEAGKAVEEATAKTSELAQSMNNIKSTEATVKTNYTASQYHASGTNNFPGGRTWVGENGPEEVILPQGTTIIPNSKLQQGETNTFYVTIDAKNVDDFNKVVDICKQKKQANRRGVL